uniref:Uncharacterized protein n=1 Tax=Oryza punctata TaxID=4537 RepID=A0A0E0LE79_ORYPU
MGARFRVGRIRRRCSIPLERPHAYLGPDPDPDPDLRTPAYTRSPELSAPLHLPSTLRRPPCERLAVEAVKLFSSGMNQQDRSFWSYVIGYNCAALIILGNANRELDQRAKALAEEREAL